MTQVITPLQGSVSASATINVRRGAPNRTAPVSRQLLKGEEFRVIGLTAGEAVAGQDDWYVGDAGEYVWSGAVRVGGVGFVSGSGLRREDGTLRPLPNDQIEALYGRFSYREGRGGAIVIDGTWERDNIVDIRAPASIRDGVTMRVHKRAAPYFERVLRAIDAAGLGEFILSYDGGFVPRHKGWDPRRSLSSHSWGIAIDVNVRWNGYGAAPAALGERGSVREIVPMFAAEGFAWGGYFQPQAICDGMHFELARTDIQ